MNKTLIITLCGIGGAVVLAILILFGMGISFHNKEISLRNLIVNKQTDNKNEMDSMWKTISQVAQVAEKDRASLMEIFNGYAQSRSGVGDNASLMKWIQESVPNVDNRTMLNLQNNIVSQRDGFKFRQKEILDFKREHDNLIDSFPNNIFATLLNRSKINVTIVTSSRTEKAFQDGKDDDVNVFSK